MERHISIVNKMHYFEYEHLPEGPLRDTSQQCWELAWKMYYNEDLEGEQLTLGLQRLIEAKDCFVRSAIK